MLMLRFLTNEFGFMIIILFAKEIKSWRDLSIHILFMELNKNKVNVQVRNPFLRKKRDIV